MLSEGLWIIPLVTLLGALIFFIQSYRSSKSNSMIHNPHGPTIDNTGNVPMYKMGRFWFGVALTVATGVILLLMRADR